MAIALGLFAVFAYRFEQSHPRTPSPDAAHPGVPVLGKISPSDITHIGAIGAKGSYAIEHAGGTEPWKMKRPQGADADARKAAEIANAVASMQSRNSLSPEEIDPNQSIYGLSPPELILTVDGNFGRKVFSFGKKIAVGGRRYLQPENDGRILVVDDAVFNLLNSAPDDVRDRKPIAFDAAAVERIDLKRENDSLQLVKKDGKWMLHFGSTEAEADAGFVEAKLKQLSAIRVSRFVDEPDQPIAFYGLALPRLVVDISAPGKSPDAEPQKMQIQFGEGVSVESVAANEAGDAVPRGKKAFFFRTSKSPFVYETETPGFIDLLKGSEFFRRRTPWTELNPDSIERVEIQTADRDSASLKREDSGWTMTIGEKSEALDAKRKVNFDGWLKSLSSLKVLSYAPPVDAAQSFTGLSASKNQLKIFIKDKPRPYLLVIGSEIKDSGELQGSSVGLDDFPKENPHWIAVTQQDGSLLPAIVDAFGYKEITRGSAIVLNAR